MIECTLGERNVYDFALEIFGDASGAPDVRFVVAHPSGHLVCIPAAVGDGGSYRVELCVTPGMIPAGQHPCSLEVVIGDRYFKPLFETLRVSEPVAVSATAQAATVKPAVTVSTKPVMVQPQVAAQVVQPEAPPVAESKAEVPPEAPKAEPKAEAPKPEPKVHAHASEAGLVASLLRRKH